MTAADTPSSQADERSTEAREQWLSESYKLLKTAPEYDVAEGYLTGTFEALRGDSGPMATTL